MNVVFTALIFISLAVMLFTSPAQAFPSMIAGVQNAITLSLKLLAVYAVWLSVLNMARATSLDKKLSRLLRPVIRRLFKDESEDAYDNKSVNLASNMLGMGGAATPAGIRAMHSMERGGYVATPNMILLIVINATSVQLIPATVIALRAQAGSAHAASIFLPTLISTTVSTLSGILICKTLSLKDKGTNDKTATLNSDFARKKLDFGKYIAKMRRTK